MKKIVAILISILILASLLGGCGSQPAVQPVAQTEETAVEAVSSEPAEAPEEVPEEEVPEEETPEEEAR